jgi:hypothetical protein
VYSRRKYSYTGGYWVHKEEFRGGREETVAARARLSLGNGDVVVEGKGIKVIFVCDVPHGISWARRKGFSQQSRINLLSACSSYSVCQEQCTLSSIDADDFEEEYSSYLYGANNMYFQVVKELLKDSRLSQQPDTYSFQGGQFFKCPRMNQAVQGKEIAGSASTEKVLHVCICAGLQLWD